MEPNPDHPNDEISSSDCDVVDGGCFGRLTQYVGKDKREQQAGGSTLDLVTGNNVDGSEKIKLPAKNDEYYSTGRTRAGLLIMLAHENFIVAGDEQILNTDEDIKLVRTCFENLDFEVRVYKDLKLREIRKIVIGASKANFDDYDSFVMIVSTKGNNLELFAKDAAYSPSNELYDNFLPTACPSLLGKPKVFILNADQVGRYNKSGKSKVETDGAECDEYIIPAQSDFLLVHTSIEGFHRFDSTSACPSFIKILTKKLIQHADQYDLLTILTLVNQELVYIHGSFINILSTLIRRIRFMRK